MEAIISGNYSDGTKLDAVLCSNDSTALGVTNALEAAGWTAENMPIITGQDCDIANVKNMLAGKQSMSVFKDTRTLADQVVEMVKALMEGKTAPTEETIRLRHKLVKDITTRLEAFSLNTVISGFMEYNNKMYEIANAAAGKALEYKYITRPFKAL